MKPSALEQDALEAREACIPAYALKHACMNIPMRTFMHEFLDVGVERAKREAEGRRGRQLAGKHPKEAPAILLTKS